MCVNNVCQNDLEEKKKLRQYICVSFNSPEEQKRGPSYWKSNLIKFN